MAKQYWGMRLKYVSHCRSKLNFEYPSNWVTELFGVSQVPGIDTSDVSYIHFTLDILYVLLDTSFGFYVLFIEQSNIQTFCQHTFKFQHRILLCCRSVYIRRNAYTSHHNHYMRMQMFSVFSLWLFGYEELVFSLGLNKLNNIYSHHQLKQILYSSIMWHADSYFNKLNDFRLHSHTVYLRYTIKLSLNYIQRGQSII